jgi:hypothetical protein
VKVKTMALVGALVLGLGYAGLQAAPWPAPRSSSEMARPRKMKIPAERNRGRVIVQMCWYPAEKAQISIGWKLGPASNGLTFDRVGAPLNCGTPWQRTAVLTEGDSAIVSWSTLVGPVSKYKIRFTVNNRVRIDVTTTEGAGARSCVIGAPPCELP